jgi:hypothetical protein
MHIESEIMHCFFVISTVAKRLSPKYVLKASEC